eukprot:1022704-Pyramimonas_sp.AAC.2
MRVKVALSPHESTSGDQAHVWVECGNGDQILRWLAFTACARLAYLRGDAPQQYVPQAVNANDGTVLDVDLVLNEVLSDGDGLTVEFGHGPEAFKIRWDGRPSTPTFQWGEEGIIGPSDHEWLEELDMKAFGVDRLVDENLVAQNPAALDQDLNATKEVLKQYAGGLQNWTTESQGSGPSDEVSTRELSRQRSYLSVTPVDRAPNQRRTGAVSLNPNPVATVQTPIVALLVFHTPMRGWPSEHPLVTARSAGVVQILRGEEGEGRAGLGQDVARHVPPGAKTNRLRQPSPARHI